MGNLSHLFTNQMAQKFSHKFVRVNIYPCPMVKRLRGVERRRRKREGNNTGYLTEFFGHEK